MKRSAEQDLLWGEQERERRLRSAILRLLKKHGPMSARGMAAKTQRTGEFSVVHCARQLLDSGRVETRTLIDPKKTQKAVVLLWLIPGDNREPAAGFNGGPGRPALEPEDEDDLRMEPLMLAPNISEADLAWQAYWRLPRAERRGLPPPESGRGIAGWDCPRTLDELRQGGLSEAPIPELVEGEGRP
jgi:hypothetical protein